MHRRKRNRVSFGLCCLFVLYIGIAALSVTLPIVLYKERTMTPFELQMIQNQTLLLGSDEMLNAGDVIVIQTLLNNVGGKAGFNITVENSRFVDTRCQPTFENNFIASILPNSTVSCMAAYVITQDDIGTIFNLSTSAANVTVSSATNLTQTTFGELSVSHMFEVDEGPDAYLTVGDLIRITAKLFNSGTETILDLESNTNGIVWTINQMLPVQMETISLNYRITQEDLDAEMYLINTTSSGIGTTSRMAVSGQDSQIVNLTRPAIGELEVQVFFTYSQSCTKTGDVVVVTIIVTNTGTGPVTSVSVEDTLVGTGFVCQPMGMDNQIGDMFPLDSFACTGVYILMGSDVTFGFNTTLMTTATVTGDSGGIIKTAMAQASYTGPFEDYFEVNQGSNPIPTVSGGPGTINQNLPVDLIRVPLTFGATRCSTEREIAFVRPPTTGSRIITYDTFNLAPNANGVGFLIGQMLDTTIVDVTTVPPSARLEAEVSLSGNIAYDSVTGRITTPSSATLGGQLTMRIPLSSGITSLSYQFSNWNFADSTVTAIFQSLIPQ